MIAKNNEALITAPTVQGLHSNARTDIPHSAEVGEQRKAFASLQAGFAMAGWEFTTIAADGYAGPFLATRWGMARTLGTMVEAAAFAVTVGVRE